MCFSASASFVASSLLSTIGIASLTLNKRPEYRLFAMSPLLFGIQQACEGIVWLTVNDYSNTLIHTIAVYIFLSFAGMVWPLWAPITLWFIEKEPQQKRIMLWFLVAGIFVASGTAYSFLTKPITAQIVSHSIYYDFSALSHEMSLFGYAMYGIPTIIPFFITRMPYAKILGISLIVSLVLAEIVKAQTAASVWCFFGALLSSLVLFIVTRE